MQEGQIMPYKYTGTVPRICEHCGGAFKTAPYKVRAGEAKYCGRACKGAAWHAQSLQNEIANLWARVTKSNHCWEFVGPRDQDGYGLISPWDVARGKRVGMHVHRYVWQLTYGPIPDGLWILHRCDNPPCCRPDHLFLGTNLDNVADMVAKGRQSGRHTSVPSDSTWQADPRYDGQRGSLHSHAKLDENKVREIRRRRAAGETLAAMAAEFGVTPGLIGHVIHRRAWKHVA
jgi:hypothetical protein